MPWDCKSCGTSVEADTVRVCPSCQELKTAWTMHEQTRTFVVTGGRRLKVLRGTSEATAPQLSSAELVEATCALVLEKQEALAIAARGHQPASYHVLRARLFPRSAKNLTVTLTINFEEEEVEELEFPQERPPDLTTEGHVDVRFLLVHGPEQELPTFEGLHVVDLTEETESGFAPSIEVTAFKKKPTLLPTAAPPLGYLSVELRDASGSVPLAGRAVSVALPSGTIQLETDDDGRLFHADVPFADIELTLGDQRVFVPAVAAPTDLDHRRVPGVPLGFVRVVVRGAHGYPLAQESVTLTSANGESVSGTTDAEGVLQLDRQLPPGEATLDVDGVAIPLTLPATPDGLVIATPRLAEVSA